MELNREIAVAILQFLDEQSNVRKYRLNNLVQFYHSEMVRHLAAKSLLKSLEVLEAIV